MNKFDATAEAGVHPSMKAAGGTVPSDFIHPTVSPAMILPTFAQPSGRAPDIAVICAGLRNHGKAITACYLSMLEWMLVVRGTVPHTLLAISLVQA